MVTGSGKTAVLLTAWALADYPRPMLILTKAMGRDVYGRDARWALGADFVPSVLVGGSESSPGIHNSYGRRVYTSLAKALSESLSVVVNYEILRQRFDELQQVNWRAMMLDEVHEIKGGYRPAKKRDGSYHHLKYHRCVALAGGVRGRGGPVWSSTATPIINRRRDLFAQLDIIAPGAFGSSYYFLKHFCDGHINDWGGLVADGATHTEELQERLTNIFYIVRRSDIKDQLPPLRRDVKYVPCGSGSFAHMGGGVETALDRAAEAKMPAVKDLCHQYLTEKLKIAVVTTRRRLAHKLALDLSSTSFAQKLTRSVRESLTIKCITGETPAAPRRQEIEQFNRLPEGPAVIVASLEAIKESIDIQQTDIVLIVSFPVKPGALVQLEGRFSRIGGRPVLIIYLVAERTIDEAYKELVIDKMADTEKIGAQTQGAGGAYDALAGADSDAEIIDKLAAALSNIEDDGNGQS